MVTSLASEAGDKVVALGPLGLHSDVAVASSSEPGAGHFSPRANDNALA